MAVEIFLYCIGMLVEFMAFVRLMMKYPSVRHAYRIPMGTLGCVLMLILPSALVIAMLAFSLVKIALISLGALAVGLVLHPFLKFVRKKRWLRFSIMPGLLKFEGI
ncbi:hypothetical protein IEQ34_015053 [Dendrobium chrysotoxum]|uniref:Amino acid permease n=1 Tax=Dendrobium chrysotoxum TaxID=161865 RepID=A0AAV7GLU3_DENCH|nr:hypothetical protein IEQ34_015053 [Dendrobium chrysotoxum]